MARVIPATVLVLFLAALLLAGLLWWNNTEATVAEADGQNPVGVMDKSRGNDARQRPVKADNEEATAAQEDRRNPVGVKDKKTDGEACQLPVKAQREVATVAQEDRDIPVGVKEETPDEDARQLPDSTKLAGATFGAALLGGALEAAAKHLAFDTWQGQLSQLRPDASFSPATIPSLSSLSLTSEEFEVGLLSLGPDFAAVRELQSVFPQIKDAFGHSSINSSLTGTRRLTLTNTAGKRLLIETHSFNNVGSARITLLGFAVDVSFPSRSSKFNPGQWHERFTRLQSPQIGDNCLEWDRAIAFQNKNVVILAKDLDGGFAADELRAVAVDLDQALSSHSTVSEADFEALRPSLDISFQRTTLKDRPFPDMGSNEEVSADSKLNYTAVTHSIASPSPIGTNVMDCVLCGGVCVAIWGHPTRGSLLQSKYGEVGTFEVLIYGLDSARLIPGWEITMVTVESR